MACAGLLRHGMSTGKKHQYGYYAANQYSQNHAFKQIFNVVRESIILRYQEVILSFLIDVILYQRQVRNSQWSRVVTAKPNRQLYSHQYGFMFHKGINRICVDCRAKIVALHQWECSNSFLLLEFKWLWYSASVLLILIKLIPLSSHIHTPSYFN